MAEDPIEVYERARGRWRAGIMDEDPDVAVAICKAAMDAGCG